MISFICHPSDTRNLESSSYDQIAFQLKLNQLLEKILRIFADHYWEKCDLMEPVNLPCVWGQEEHYLIAHHYIRCTIIYCILDYVEDLGWNRLGLRPSIMQSVLVD